MASLSILAALSPDLIGSIAAVLTSIAFVPQTVQCIRTRNLSGVSLSMYSLYCAGIALWLLYGIAINSTPVIVSNIVTLALSTTILMLKLHALGLLPQVRVLPVRIFRLFGRKGPAAI